MKSFQFSVLIFLACICLLVLAKPGKHGRDKNGKPPRMRTPFGLKGFSSCKGETVNFGDKLESSVQECLNIRVENLEQQRQEMSEKDKGKKEEKLQKRKVKMEQKIRRKCTPECEWQTFDLVPEMNSTSNYSSIEIPDNFIQVFPKSVQETLKSKMERCYNIASPILPKKSNKKGGTFLQRMCITNRRLVKCLGRSIRQSCRGKTNISSGTGVTVTGNTTDLNKDGIVSATTTSPAAQDDDDDDDDDKELDDDDDDDEDQDDDDKTETTTTKDAGTTAGTTKSPGTTSGTTKSPGTTSGTTKSPGTTAGTTKSPGATAGTTKSPGPSTNVDTSKEITR